MITFCCGLMKDPRPLVDHVYQMYVQMHLRRMRGTEETDEDEAGIQLEAQGKNKFDVSLFHSLHAESVIKLPDHPLHNKHINCYDQGEDDYKKRPRDTTPICTPSRHHQFIDIKEDVQCNIHHTEHDADQPECGIYINEPDEVVAQSLLTTCHNISKHQPLTDLDMQHVICRDLPSVVEVPIMSGNARSLTLVKCDLPVRFMRNILRQLIDSGCVTLQLLWLYKMDLSPWEEELDELMEQLVSHHAAGEAQGMLRVWLGDKDLKVKTNLSEEFEEKWRRRCTYLSIECLFI